MVGIIPLDFDVSGEPGGSNTAKMALLGPETARIGLNGRTFFPHELFSHELVSHKLFPHDCVRTNFFFRTMFPLHGVVVSPYTLCGSVFG